MSNPKAMYRTADILARTISEMFTGTVFSAGVVFCFAGRTNRLVRLDLFFDGDPAASARVLETRAARVSRQKSEVKMQKEKGSL